MPVGDGGRVEETNDCFAGVSGGSLVQTVEIENGWTLDKLVAEEFFGEAVGGVLVWEGQELRKAGGGLGLGAGLGGTQKIGQLGDADEDRKGFDLGGATKLADCG